MSVCWFVRPRPITKAPERANESDPVVQYRRERYNSSAVNRLFNANTSACKSMEITGYNNRLGGGGSFFGSDRKVHETLTERWWRKNWN